jgi:hypothetical protein
MSKPSGVSAASNMPPQPIIDEPGQHGMFMLGSETLFLCHMPMFTAEKHMYQVILRASLPPAIMQQYQALRQNYPNKPYNLQNTNEFTLPQIKTGEVGSYPATIYDGYSGEDPGPPLFGTDTNPVTVTIEDVVRYRHFHFGIVHPSEMTKRRVALGRGTPRPDVNRLNQRWSLDFVHDSLSSARRIRTLNIVDDFSRECLAIEVDTSLSGKRVMK